MIAGALGFWLMGKLIPALPGLTQSVRSKSSIGRTKLISNNAERLRQDTLRHVQGLHLASPLFALDEILVEPRILALPTTSQPTGDNRYSDILSRIIPYLPDWPDLAARYSAKTKSLADALGNDANLILTGGPGSGKTTALAALICNMVRKEQSAASLSGYLPIYTHVSDMFPDNRFDQPPLDHIRDALHTYAGSLSIKRLETLIQQAFQGGKALLLVDGLDEVAPEFHIEVTKFLASSLEEYPGIRLVVTSSPENYSGLIELGLVPVAIAAWNEQRYLSFVNKWSRSWFRYIRPALSDTIEQIDPRLLNAWLLADNPIITPFDATLKAWAVFAGDTVGPGYIDSIESYIWRLTNHLENSRPGLEDFALQMVASQEVAQDLKRTRGWEDELTAETNNTDPETDRAYKDLSKRGRRSTRKLSGVIPELLESGLLVERAAGRFSFCHPVIMGSMASAALADMPVSHFLSNQPDWTGKSLTLLFLATSREISPEVSDLLTSDDDPLFRRQLTVGRWLRYAPQSATWRTQAMRYLATEFQRSNIPLGLRARLLSALLLSGDPGVGVLLRQISHTTSDDLCYLSALGMGYMMDHQSLGRLRELLSEPEIKVSQAACFALVMIGNQQAFEVLGSALLEGSDELRRAAAEALALDLGEGHEMLKEASQMDNLLVRRSAVYGLARVGQPWAEGVLNKLALEDKEWVVRSAATQIIEQDQETDPSIPHAPLPLHETPWLIAFAGDRGIGIAPGQPAENLLLAALAEGSPEQQQSALECLQAHPNLDALPLIHEIIESGLGDSQEAAFNTLFSFASQGLNI